MASAGPPQRQLGASLTVAVADGVWVAGWDSVLAVVLIQLGARSGLVAVHCLHDLVVAEDVVGGLGGVEHMLDQALTGRDPAVL